MKTASFPSLRVDPALRKAAEDVLQDGESISSFVADSIRDSVERRKSQKEFLARGLLSRETAKRTNEYVFAEKVTERLEKMLAKAKAKGKAG